jgi:hypothetical protein
MRVEWIAEKIEARVLAAGAPERAEVVRAWAGDRISDLLNQASSATLVITHSLSPHLIRVAELVDLAAVCLVGNPEPDPEFLAGARSAGLWVLVAPGGLFETCGRLYPLLGAPVVGERP